MLVSGSGTGRVPNPVDETPLPGVHHRTSWVVASTSMAVEPASATGRPFGPRAEPTVRFTPVAGGELQQGPKSPPLLLGTSK